MFRRFYVETFFFVEETFAPLRYFPFLFLAFAVGLDGIS